MSEAFFTTLLALNYDWSPNLLYAVNALRSLIQTSLCVLCWYTIISVEKNTALSFFLSFSASIQTFLNFIVVANDLNIKMLPLVALDLTYTAVGINWMIIERTNTFIPVIFDIYGYWALIWWIYSVVIYNVLIGTILSVLILYNVQYIDEESQNEGYSSEEGAQNDDLKHTEVMNFIKEAWGSALAMETCTICLGDFANGEEVRKMPCKHLFHTECIDEWLKKHKRCPLCRRKPSEVAAAQNV